MQSIPVKIKKVQNRYVEIEMTHSGQRQRISKRVLTNRLDMGIYTAENTEALRVKL